MIADMMSMLREAVTRQRLLNRLMAGGTGIRIARTVDVRTPQNLRLGNSVFIDNGVLLHCGGMEWCPGGGITIGAHSYIGPNCVLFGAGEIEIGESALISPGVVITSHQHTTADVSVDMRRQPLEFGRVVLERDVWIGANAVILPGVRIGAGSVVGAGAVVTRDLPSRAVALGVPARVVRER